jgi:hypothetical protein
MPGVGGEEEGQGSSVTLCHMTNHRSSAPCGTHVGWGRRTHSQRKQCVCQKLQESNLFCLGLCRTDQDGSHRAVPSRDALSNDFLPLGALSFDTTTPRAWSDDDMPDLVAAILDDSSSGESSDDDRPLLGELNDDEPPPGVYDNGGKVLNCSPTRTSHRIVKCVPPFAAST